MKSVLFLTVLFVSLVFVGATNVNTLLILGNDRDSFKFPVGCKKVIELTQNLKECGINARVTLITFQEIDVHPRDVVSKHVQTQQQFDNALNLWFTNFLQKNNDSLFVFYAGHGSENYLELCPYKKIRLSRQKLVDSINKTQAKLKILITDACKNKLSHVSPYFMQRKKTKIQWHKLAKPSLDWKNKEKKKLLLKRLFLNSNGFFYISAARDEEKSLADSDSGGYLTSNLLKTFVAFTHFRMNPKYYNWHDCFYFAKELVRSKSMEVKNKEDFFLPELISSPLNKRATVSPLFVSSKKGQLIGYKEKNGNETIYSILEAKDNLKRIKFVGYKPQFVKTKYMDVMTGFKTDRLYFDTFLTSKKTNDKLTVVLKKVSSTLVAKPEEIKALKNIDPNDMVNHLSKKTDIVYAINSSINSFNLEITKDLSVFREKFAEVQEKISSLSLDEISDLEKSVNEFKNKFTSFLKATLQIQYLEVEFYYSSQKSSLFVASKQYVKKQKKSNVYIGFGFLRHSNLNRKLDLLERSGFGIEFFTNGDIYYGYHYKSQRCGFGLYLKKENGHVTFIYAGPWFNDLSNTRKIIKNKPKHFVDFIFKFTEQHITNTLENAIFDQNVKEAFSRGDIGICMDGVWTYIGQWKQDSRDGRGKIYQGKRIIYHGSWKNDLYHGKGTSYYSTSSWFEGHFNNGKKHGKGVYHYYMFNVIKREKTSIWVEDKAQ